jgi:hypothetical protein
MPLLSWRSTMPLCASGAGSASLMGAALQLASGAM